MGPLATEWLTSFFTRIVQEKRIPKLWRWAKIIAIPKPNKDHSIAATKKLKKRRRRRHCRLICQVFNVFLYEIFILIAV